ncbi:hypothetical protein IVB12_28435 [Bradyrhizobium sp. 179]|nr:hypothetical protein [Bradyrhizobium sp. 179]
MTSRSRNVGVADFFRSHCASAKIVHLAFEPQFLDALQPAPSRGSDVSFVVAASADRQERLAQLEAVARRHNVKLFGSGLRTLCISSRLHRC